jgi:hypothetical protein
VTPQQVRSRPGTRWLPPAFGLTVAAGIVAGWGFRPAPTFDEVYAVLSPIGFGAICVSSLLNGAKPARWVVPCSLVLVMATTALRAHVASLTALGIAAGVLAILTSLRGRRYPAIAGVLLCCASISASLFIASLR